MLLKAGRFTLQLIGRRAAYPVRTLSIGWVLTRSTAKGATLTIQGTVLNIMYCNGTLRVGIVKRNKTLQKM